MKEKMLFKGDLIWQSEDERGIPHKMLWCQKVHGVRENILLTEVSLYIIFHRPFRNHIKNVFWILQKSVKHLAKVINNILQTGTLKQSKPTT